MTTTLITGATQGIGREAAAQLAGAGHTVWLGARDLTRGREVAATIGARPVQLDVTDPDSVAAAVAEVRGESGVLDVLVNNAGVGDRSGGADVTADGLARVYATNVLGPLRVFQAFRPLLEAAAAPLVVNVSSGFGSLRILTADPDATSGWVAPAYASSKAALNMLTQQLSLVLPGIRFVAVDPGYTATGLNGHRGTQTVAEGARSTVGVVTGTLAVPTGSFADAGGVIPW